MARTKRGKKAPALLAVLLVIAGTAYYLLRDVTVPPTGSALREFPVVVLSVTDGDTFKARYQGIEERIRLIGVDAPESRRNQKAMHDAERSGVPLDDIVAMGKKSSAFLKELLPEGAAVRLEFDKDQRDRYGRLLAYVYLEDGRMVNERLLEEGYAEPMTVHPNDRYAREFDRTSVEARRQRKGLWALGLQPRQQLN